MRGKDRKRRKVLKKTILFFVLLMSFVFAANESIDAKVVYLQFNYTNGSVVLDDQSIYRGYPPKNLFESDDGIKVEVLSQGQSVIDSFYIGDPRNATAERFYENGTIEGETLTLNDTVFRVIIPFTKQTQFVRLSQDGKELINVSLNEAVAFFCGIPDGICDSDCVFDVDCQASVNSTNVSSSTQPEKPTGIPAVTKTKQQPEENFSTQKADLLPSVMVGIVAVMVILAVYGLLVGKRK